ncbi:MAG: hypothetical protein ACRCWQ_14500 [Bacilli bacterium]
MNIMCEAKVDQMRIHLETLDDVISDIKCNRRDEGECDDVNEVLKWINEQVDTDELQRNLFNSISLVCDCCVRIIRAYQKQGCVKEAQMELFDKNVRMMKLHFRKWDSTQIPFELMTDDELAIYKGNANEKV